jgi:hypothetical protein
MILRTALAYVTMAALAPDAIGRCRYARRHTILRYLPGALPIQR